MLQLAAMVVGSGAASSKASSKAIAQGAAQDYLNSYLESFPRLSDGERARLNAHFTWLLQEKLTLRGVKGKLNKMTAVEKGGIADLLVGIAGVEGGVSPPKVATLTKIYPLLGLEAVQVYSHVHQCSASSANRPAKGPITVRPAAQTSTGFTIPEPSLAGDRAPHSPKDGTDSPGFTLDLAAIHQKEQESAQVTALLGELFDEDEPAETGATFGSGAAAADPPSGEHHPGDGGEDGGEDGGAIAGLDALHSQFLQILSQEASWQRQVLETQADQLGLMLDGALEVINDAAFEVCDSPLTEGEDPIVIDSDILGELLP